MPPENDNPLAEIRQVKNDNGEFTYLKMPARPAGIPDKFWNEEQGLNLTALNNGYLALESSRAQFREDTRRALAEEFEQQKPKAPASYTVKPVELESPPAGFAYDPATDPVIQSVMAVGKDLNLPQEGLDTLTKARATQELERFKATGEQVRSVLGENAQARIEKLTSRLKDSLAPEEFQAVSELISAPQAVVALEKLAGTRALPGAGDGGQPHPDLSEAKLRSMMSDPRYWDPQRRDPEYCKEIEQGFARLYADQRHDGQPRFTSR